MSFHCFWRKKSWAGKIFLLILGSTKFEPYSVWRNVLVFFLGLLGPQFSRLTLRRWSSVLQETAYRGRFSPFDLLAEDRKFKRIRANSWKNFHVSPSGWEFFVLKVYGLKWTLKSRQYTVFSRFVGLSWRLWAYFLRSRTLASMLAKWPQKFSLKFPRIDAFSLPLDRNCN